MRQRRLDEGRTGEAATDAGEALVGVDLQQGVHLFVGVGAAGPAGVVGGAAERNGANRDRC